MYHMRTYHETENKCDECEYKNGTRVQITNHMRTNHETCFVYKFRISFWVDMQKKIFQNFLMILCHPDPKPVQTSYFQLKSSSNQLKSSKN